MKTILRHFRYSATTIFDKLNHKDTQNKINLLFHLSVKSELKTNEEILSEKVRIENTEENFVVVIPPSPLECLHSKWQV